MKKLLHFTMLSILLLVGSLSFAQNGIIGSGFTNGFGVGDILGFNANAGTSRELTLQPRGTGNQFFRLVRNWSGDLTQFGPFNCVDTDWTTPGLVYGMSVCNTSGAFFINCPNTTDNYVFKTPNSVSTVDFLHFRVQGAVRSVSSVSQLPAAGAVLNNQAVAVTANLNGALSAGQAVYIRYTTNGFSASTVAQMTGSGTTYTSTIPANAGGTNVAYYIFTSGTTNVATNGSNADLYSINFNNNGGSNYGYAVSANNILVTATSGSSLLATYPTLAAAITAINTAGIHFGTVVCNVPAGYTETAPVGGYSITATGTIGNTITFQKSGAGANPVLTASVGVSTPASLIPDGIMKFNGSDYIIIDGLTFTDANTTNPATMEFGIGFFKASTSDGCNNNIVRNCVVNMQRINNAAASGPMVEGSVGILFMNSTSIAATTNLLPASAAGTNSNNKIYSNTTNNGNYGIVMIGYASASPFTLSDTNNDVGGTSAATGNTILNYGGGAATSPSAGIRTLAQYGLNVSYNTVNNNNGSGVNHATTLRGIFINTAVSASANINNNTVTVNSGATTSLLEAISNASGSTAASNTINMNNNVIVGTYSTATSGTFNGITNSGSATTVNINSNTLSNMTIAGTGTNTMIELGSPVTGFMNNNTISNITRTGVSGTQYGLKVVSPTNSTVTGNTVDGINFTNLTSTGSIFGFYALSSPVNQTISNNTIKNLSTSTTGTLVGIRENGVSGTKIIQNNIVSNFSTTSGGVGGATMNGIWCTVGNIEISGNTVFALNSTGTTGGTSGTINGIQINGGTTNSVFRNKVYDISSTSTNPAVAGITVSAGTTTTIYNNVINQINAPATSATNSVNGINVSGGTTVNAYHNTVVMTGTSSAATFGTSAFYGASSTNIILRNNIFINNSVPKGAGFAAAYRRSGLLTVANYPIASDNNIFYAGTPSANNVIFYDGTTVRSTLADYKTFVATRDIASQTENVAFISTAGANADFLRIALGTTSFAESGGALVSSPLINTDYFGITRPFVAPVNGGTAVDIGASEFDGIPNLVSCIAPVDQATAYVAGAVTSNTAAATFTAAASAPSGYLVITSQGAFVGTPVNGTVYSFGAVIGNGLVLQSGASTTINAVGLPSNTVGTITIIAYNSGACAGGPKYNLTAPLTGTNTTCAGTPTLPVTNAVTASGFTANWTQTGGIAFPITYSIEVTTDAAFAVPVVGSPFTSATTSLVVSGLNAQTAYFWRVRGNNTVCDSAFLNSSATTECNAITAYPSVEPFTTYLPSVCWKEGDLGDLVAGPATIGAALTSDWGADDYLNATGTGTGAAKMNIDTASGSEWILSPYYTIPASGYRVKYNVGATQFGAINGALTTPWEADDFVELLVSTSTTNWSVLKTYNSANVPSNLGQIDTADLSPYNGQTVRFAFRAFEGATNGAADIDFFVDNFTVEIEPIAITVSAPVAVCAGDSSTLTVSSANTNYAYTWSPSLGLDTTSGATVIATPATTTTYTVTAVDGGMTNTGTVTVTVNPAPTAVSIAPATATVCVDDITALVATGGSSAAVATIGLATTTTTATEELTAFNNRRLTFWSQTIYTAAELSAAGLSAGNITSLSYNVNSLGDAASNANFTVKIGATANSNFATTALLPTASMTEVFPSATFTHSATGWQLINFATPYVWDGTSNIVVNVTQSGIDDIENAQTFYSTTVDSKTNYVFNNLATTTGTLSTKRMNIRLGYLSVAPITWSPVTDLYTDAAATVPYTGTPATTVYHKGLANSYTATATLGLCTKTATSTISVNAPVLPTFFNPLPICAGGVVALPIISTNGITGTWSPAPNNTVTTLYSFTPTAGQCATSGAFITQVVNQNVSSTFAAIAPICIGDTVTLPTTSLEGNAGTWSPAINNIATTTYTFTPNSGLCALPGTLTVAVGTTTTWTAGTPNFWDNGAPTSTSSAIINAPYSEAANLTACSLSVNAVTSIPSGFTVDLQGAITVNSGSFTLQNNANLVQARDVANTGNIIVKRTTANLMRQDYVLWSSPVENQLLQAFSPGTLENRFYTYNPTTNEYNALATPATSPFSEGTGYLIRVPNAHPTTPTPLTRTFTGVPHNGPLSIGVTAGTFNAVGNPYPSAINADMFLTTNAIAVGEPLYFWRKTNSTLATSTAYATYTTAGGTANTGFDPLNLVPNGKIQVGQGFLVKASGTSLNFSNTMRISDAGPFLRQTENRNRIWLNLTNTDGLFNQSLIAYMPNATSGIDAAIDGRLLTDENGSTLSSLINNEEFAIQGRALPFEATDVVPMAFKSNTAGSYSIAINQVDGLFDTTAQNIYLQDNVAGIVHDLATPYTFATAAGVFNSRFVVVYQPTGTLSIAAAFNDNAVVVYKKANDIVINTGKVVMDKVSVYDISGRLLIEKTGVNASDLKIPTNTTNQVLVVKITATTNEVVTKKVIN